MGHSKRKTVPRGGGSGGRVPTHRVTRNMATAALESLCKIEVENIAPPTASSSPEAGSSGGGEAKSDVTPTGSRVVVIGATPPPRWQELDQKMDDDELIRKLVAILWALNNRMEENAQDEEFVRAYGPLSFRLASEEFLKHHNARVKIVVAFCLAECFRLFGPPVPVKDDKDNNKTIFLFFIEQLEGLKDCKGELYEQYKGILDSVKRVKVFTFCLSSDFAEEIVCSLFKLMFSVIRDNDDPDPELRSHILDLLCPIIHESKTISKELLGFILEKIAVRMEEYTALKMASEYNLAKDIVFACSASFQKYIEDVIQVKLFKDTMDEHLAVTDKDCDLIYSLYQIYPNVILSILPELEYKLRSMNKWDRYSSVKLLCRMFSAKECTLGIEYMSLWRAFLGRFNDSWGQIRAECVKSCKDFLLFHPKLRGEILQVLGSRSYDLDKNVRLEVIKTIVIAARKDVRVVSENEVLLHYLKERTWDTTWQIRKEALKALALIYVEYWGKEKTPPKILQACNGISNAILRAYFVKEVGCRIFVEQLVHTFLLPYKFDPQERMIQLIQFISYTDEIAFKGFIEMQQNYANVRHHIAQLLEILAKKSQSDEEIINTKISDVTNFLADPVVARKFITKFISEVSNDKEMMQSMEALVNPKTDCNAWVKEKVKILEKLGLSSETKNYPDAIKMLLERTSSVLIDKEAAAILGSNVQQLVQENVNLQKIPDVALSLALEKRLRLISALSFLHPHHFNDEKVLGILLNLLKSDRLSGDHLSRILTALMFIGKNIIINNNYPNQVKELVRIFEKMALNGTPKQAKMAVRCLFVFINDGTSRKRIFTQILASIQGTLMNPSSANFRTAITSLGHIAYLMPKDFTLKVDDLIKRLTHNLLINPQRSEDDLKKTSGMDWCNEESLPQITQCGLAAIKATARCIIGLKMDLKQATIYFKLFITLVHVGSDVCNVSVKLSSAEDAWLRLSAGCAILKICELKGIVHSVDGVEFLKLSTLMLHHVDHVRARFATKLHKGLSNSNSSKRLPVDFMGFYALAGYESDQKLKEIIKSYMVADIEIRRDYVLTYLHQTVQFDGENRIKAFQNLPYIMPEYMLAFAVPVLMNSPKFKSSIDDSQLHEVMDCLHFVLNVLICSTHSASLPIIFYKDLMAHIKNHKNGLPSQSPVEDQQINLKMYSVCDLAIAVCHDIQEKPNVRGSRVASSNEYTVDLKISSKFFTKHEDPNFVNKTVCLPMGIRNQLREKAGGNMWVWKKTHVNSDPADGMKKGKLGKVTTSPTMPRLTREIPVLPVAGRGGQVDNQNQRNKSCGKRKRMPVLTNMTSQENIRKKPSKTTSSVNN